MKNRENIAQLELGKMPPQSVETEEALLSCCFFDNVIFDIKAIVSSKCFYKECHQIVFEAMEMLCNDMVKIDIITLTNKLRETEKLENVGGPIYIMKLSDVVSSSVNAIEYARIVYEKYVQRDLIRLFSEASNKLFDETNDPVDIIETVRTDMANLIDLKGNSISKIKSVIDLVYNKMESNLKHDNTLTGIPSGLTKLDQHTNGFQPTDLIIIAGETSQGKTSLALKVAVSSAYAGFETAFYSLEMSSLQLGARLMSQETGISSKRILMEKLGHHEFMQIDQRVSKLYNSNIYIDEKCTTKFADILNSIRLMVMKLGIKLVIIDYIQLIKNTIKNKSTADEVGDIANTLKRCAKDLNICIIALSQLTRDQNPIPSLRRLKQSGDIENAADTIIFPYRPETYQNANWFNFINYEGIPQEGLAQIIVAKGRNIGVTDFLCRFNPALTLFYNMQDDVYELPASNFEQQTNERPF